RPADDAERGALAAAIAGRAMSTTRRAITHDMVVADARGATAGGLGDDSPAFAVVRRRAVGLWSDGDPRMAAVGATGWRRCSHPPFVLLQDPGGTLFVRRAADRWVSSGTLGAGYVPAAAPPAGVVAALGREPVARGVAVKPADADAAPTSRAAPELRVFTEPTALVSIDGEPDLVDVAPGVQWAADASPLLLRTAAPTAWWTIAAGRWFRADTLDGAWTRVQPSGLPAAFAQLPGGRAFVPARASVPHTPEAVAAVAATLERRAQSLSRADARCSVRWNGAPAWQAVPGTMLRASVNASQPVIAVGPRLYCCDNAAWFSADAADGPWVLADAIPEDIASIPPASPAFPVTFVDVVASDDASVTFAWSPGYLGTYVDGGAVVFGTGFSPAAVEFADGVFASQPQTFAQPVAFDPAVGAFVAVAGTSDADAAPDVTPDMLVDGCIPWGWCPGWTSAWAWELARPGWWAAQDGALASWTPTWNRWANARAAAQRARDEADARALAERAAVDAARAEGEDDAMQRAAADEAAWRESQREASMRAVEDARAEQSREDRAQAERAARLADRRSADERARQDAARWAALARGGPIAPRGSAGWWYQFYNDYSSGYLSRATGYRDPRYPGGTRGARPGAPPAREPRSRTRVRRPATGEPGGAGRHHARGLDRRGRPQPPAAARLPRGGCTGARAPGAARVTRVAVAGRARQVAARIVVVVLVPPLNAALRRNRSTARKRRPA
ncbi:MAG: hypothetical protein ACKOQW_04505, partial [Phycisphaerales bacterium]